MNVAETDSLFSEVREKMRQIAAATKSERRKIEVRLAGQGIGAAASQEQGVEKPEDDAAAENS